MIIGSINELLIKNKFNFMGGKIYLPSMKDPSGFWRLAANDPRLDESITVESELCHFYAVDDQNFNCFGIMDKLGFPCSISVPKANLETVRVDVGTLNTNIIRAELLNDQDILVGEWPTGKLAPSLGMNTFAGIRKFGVYCISTSETAAFNRLTESMALYGLHAFHHYEYNPLGNHMINSSTRAGLNDLQRQAQNWKDKREANG